MRAFAGVVVMLFIGVVAGCKETPQDQVLSQYERSEKAIAQSDVLELKNTLTPESCQELLDAQRLALDCSASETKKLAPSMMGMVLAMRNRLEPEKLRAMDLDALLEWVTRDGPFVVNAQMGIFPCGVKISGDKAVVQLGIEVEARQPRTPRIGRRSAAGAVVGIIASSIGSKKVEAIPGFVAHYRKINGYWYSDYVADGVDTDGRMARDAREEQITVADTVAGREEEEFGSIKKDIWRPVGR